MIGVPNIYNAMKVADLEQSLPSARTRRRMHAEKNPTKPMPSSLPACFADVWRRRQSALPAHKRERASLEAVASTIPEDARGFSGSAAAAVYLAALCAALERLISTTTARRVRSIGVEGKDKSLSKKDKKKIKRRQLEAESAVQGMSGLDVTASALAAKKNDSHMKDDEDEQGDDKVEGDDDTELSASLIYLIGLAARGCSPAILNAKCEYSLELVMHAFDHFGEHSTLARHSSAVFATILSSLAQPAWSKPVIQRSYLYLLRQTTDTEAKARRKAREALDALLRCPRGGVIRAKTSSAAAAHYVSELKLHSDILDRLDGDTVMEKVVNPVSLIHLVTSIERFAGYLKPQDASLIAKEIVLITVKNLPEVTTFLLLALWALFKHKIPLDERSTKDSQVGTFLPQGDLGKIVCAVMRHDIPEDSSNELIISYARCLANGAAAYSEYFLHSPPSSEFILKPVEKLVQAILSSNGNSNVNRNIAGSLQTLLSEKWFIGKPEILKMLQPIVDKSYRSTWPQCMPVIRKYLEQSMTSGRHNMGIAVSHLLKTTVRMREKAALEHDQKTGDLLQSLIAASLRGGGGAQLLIVCEPKYDVKQHITNAWILPVLRENLCGAPLSLFEQKLIPIAQKLQSVRRDLSEGNRVVEAKNVGIYESQIWALLPGFCNKPCDLGQDGVLTMAFKAIHQCLTAGNYQVMCPIGIKGLRQLSVSVLDLDPDDPSTKKKQEQFASRFKKLFRVIAEGLENMSDERRGSMLEAVTLSCRATGSPEIVSGLLKKAIRSLLEMQLKLSTNPGEQEEADAMNIDKGQTIRGQHATADLAICIAESKVVPPDAAELDYLTKAMAPFFVDTKETSLQKKAYRAASLLVSLGVMRRDSNLLRTFVKNTAEAGNGVLPGAKAARQGLVCALVDQHLFLQSDSEKLAFLQILNDGFLSEVIMGTRDVSEKGRAASFATLVALARAWNTTVSSSDMAGLQRFITDVAAGLGGKTVSMLAATLTSLGRLLYDFRGETKLDKDLTCFVDSLFAIVVPENTDMEDVPSEASMQPTMVQPGPISILLRHNALEVQKAALGVIKVATKVLADPATRLVSVLPGILPGLVHVSARSKKQEMRLKVRVILERLLRKCGRDTLEANFPEEHIKLLSAVRKQHSRDLIKKHASKERKRELRALRNSAGVADTMRGSGEGNDIENDIGLDDSDSDIEKDILDGDDMLMLQQSKLVSENANTPAEGGVTDLLNPRHSQAMKRHGPARDASMQAREERGGIKRERDDGIKFTDDGRPIFVESDNESGQVELGSASENDDSDEEQQSRQQKRSGTALSGKRKRSQMERSERETKRVKGSFGQEYKGRKGSGDVKRAGRPDPYAYVPLGMNMLGPGARLGTAGAKRNRRDSSLQHLVGRKGKTKGGRLQVPGKR